MKTISRDEVMEMKYANRKTIKGLEYHADGACVHLGKISPGCRICFTGELGGGVQIGQECNCNCSVCYYDRDRLDNWERPGRDYDILSDFFRNSFEPNFKPYTYAFQSSGETLMYIDRLLPFGPVFRKIEKDRNIKIYHYVYSNGTLIDEEMLDKLVALQVKEIRFHCSASNWSKKVLRNMEMTAKRGITLSVEEPSYPLERKNILKHLPIFNDLGVKHLNLVEVQITQHNKPDIEKEYPDARIYKDHFYHLYDEGLVYEVMREVVDKGYGYSVLDCNSCVETYRQTKNQSLGFNMDTIKGMCADFDHGER